MSSYKKFTNSDDDDECTDAIDAVAQLNDKNNNNNDNSEQIFEDNRSSSMNQQQLSRVQTIRKRFQSVIGYGNNGLLPLPNGSSSSSSDSAIVTGTTLTQTTTTATSPVVRTWSFPSLKFVHHNKSVFIEESEEKLQDYFDDDYDASMEDGR